jgi:hypothetical protein
MGLEHIGTLISRIRSFRCSGGWNGEPNVDLHKYSEIASDRDTDGNSNVYQGAWSQEIRPW